MSTQVIGGQIPAASIQLCKPCLERGKRTTATRVVAGELWCKWCEEGKPVPNFIRKEGTPKVVVKTRAEVTHTPETGADCASAPELIPESEFWNLAKPVHRDVYKALTAINGKPGMATGIPCAHQQFGWKQKVAHEYGKRYFGMRVRTTLNGAKMYILNATAETSTGLRANRKRG